MKSFIKKLLDNRTLPIVAGPLRGTRLRVNNLVKGTVFLKSYEPDKQKALDALISDQTTFFDVGANVGLHSYYVAKKFPNTKIFAFEPLPENANYLREALLNNNFKNIQIVETAVGAKSGEVFFDSRDDNSKGMISDANTGLRVKIVSLDDFIQQTNTYPDVLKIDVEGAESDVLKGAEMLISKKPPVFIIELHNPTQDLEVAKFLMAHEYEIFRVNPKAHLPSHKLMLAIKNKYSPWPDLDGVWGNIIAFPKSKLRDYERFF